MLSVCCLVACHVGCTFAWLPLSSCFLYVKLTASPAAVADRAPGPASSGPRGAPAGVDDGAGGTGQHRGLARRQEHPWDGEECQQALPAAILAQVRGGSVGGWLGGEVGGVVGQGRRHSSSLPFYSMLLFSFSFGFPPVSAPARIRPTPAAPAALAALSSHAGGAARCAAGSGRCHTSRAIYDTAVPARAAARAAALEPAAAAVVAAARAAARWKWLGCMWAATTSPKQVSSAWAGAAEVLG